jgi:hypothetical protein
LLSAQDANGKASPSDSLKDLFAQIDTNGDGKITKAEFEDKLGAGGTNVAAADNVFNKMDADNDGSVSLDEMATALKPSGGHHRAHHGGGADALMQALQGASSSSTTNSDGSITTTLTYADGSKVTISQRHHRVHRRAHRRSTIWSRGWCSARRMHLQRLRSSRFR